jgi:dTDP-4-dehydrorhamnose 3,5-epimerase
MLTPLLTRHNVFNDHRGVFAPMAIKPSNKWVQVNTSVNPQRLTLRGIHFQVQPYAQTKLIKVITGGIVDFIVNISKEDSQYLEPITFDMCPGDELIVPSNYAHGFITTEPNTIVQYLVDNAYVPEAEGSIVWSCFPSLKRKFYTIHQFNPEHIIINKKDLINRNIFI